MRNSFLQLKKFLKGHSRKSQRGFTLIELLVVMGILAVLALIAIPALSGSDEGAYLSSMESDAKNAITAEQLYYSANKQYATGVTVDATSSSTGAKQTLSGSNISIVASPFNKIDIQSSQNCNEGFVVTVTSSKTNKKVTYDSCTDTAPQVQ